MKKIFTLLIGVAFSIAILNAQAPEKFSFKATILNKNGAIVANKTVGLRLSISPGSFEETFTPTTNEFGQIDIVIGESADLSSIDWSDGEYFLKVEVDVKGGTEYQLLSETQLLSVPYALHAKTVEIGNWGIDVVKTDETLAGQGTDALPLKIADNGVTSAKIDDATITSADLADNAVISSKIINGAVTMGKIAQAEATTGQALKWNGTNWSPDNDLIGTPGGTSGSIQFNNAGALDGDANLFWDNTNKRLGVGTTTPEYPLHVVTSSNRAIYVENHSSTGISVMGFNGSASGTARGIYGGVASPNAFSGYFIGGKFYVSSNAGFGTIDPNATLDVEGTVKIGANGTIFSEIRQISAMTPSEDNVVHLAYPSGYNQTNTRILSAEINVPPGLWVTLGTYWPVGSGTLFCGLASDAIICQFPSSGPFYDRPIRILLLKIQ